MNYVSLLFKYLPYFLQAAKSVPQIMDFISEIKAIFSRDKVWTPAQEKEFDDQLEALKNDSYWKAGE